MQIKYPLSGYFGSPDGQFMIIHKKCVYLQIERKKALLKDFNN